MRPSIGFHGAAVTRQTWAFIAESPEPMRPRLGRNGDGRCGFNGRQDEALTRYSTDPSDLLIICQNQDDKGPILPCYIELNGRHLKV